MEPIHPVAWLFWLIAAVLPALLTRNPLYLSLALLATWITYQTLTRQSAASGDGSAQGWGSFVRFGAFLWLMTIPFTMLTVHYGRLVLFRLPASWPVVGGPITGEALLFGLCSGLSLLTLLLAFATFNVAVDQARLLRLTPGFLYQAGVIAAIAVAFVPQMVAAWQTVREAQEVRGHRVRGLRDLLPLIMPLLITALERAMQLAESMEARGFGRQLAPISFRRRAGQQVALLLGLAAAGAGTAGVGFWPERHLLVGLLLAAGGLLVGFSFWDQGRRVARSHYRRWQWSQAGYTMLAISGVVSVAWLAVWLVRGNDWLLYYPYPPYSPWPTFVPWVGLLAMLPVVTGLLLPETGSRRPQTGGSKPEAESWGQGAQGVAGELQRLVMVEGRAIKAEGAVARGAAGSCGEGLRYAPARGEGLRYIPAPGVAPRVPCDAAARPATLASHQATFVQAASVMSRAASEGPDQPKSRPGVAPVGRPVPPWAVITRLVVALLVMWRR